MSLRHDLGGRNDANGGRGHDQVQVGILEQLFGPILTVLGNVVPVDGVDRFAMFSYSGVASSSSSEAIQMFWLAASGVAERIAIWPPSSPRMLRAISAITWPAPLRSAGAMYTDSPSADGIGESQVTTGMPSLLGSRRGRA